MSDRNTPTGHTNIMAAKKANEATVVPKFELTDEPGDVIDDARGADSVTITGEQDKLLDMIQALTTQVAELQVAQSRTERREVETHDLTDDMLYIVRRGDRKWEERRIVNGKGVMIEFTASNFFGPFNDQDHIDLYIKAKSAKRPEYAGIWANNDVMTGREARKLNVEETHARDMAFGTHAAMGVLDHRIFAEAQGGHTPGQGTLIGEN